MSHKGKTAVVTGSALGIGRAIAIALAKEGADIAGLDVRFLENSEMVTEVRGLGRRALAICCDISDRREVRRAIAEVMQSFGRIDILVNNAGIFDLGCMVGSEFDRAADIFDRMLAVNTRAHFLCSLAVLPVMLKQGSGDIINIMSNHLKREAFPALSICHAYDAAKWAQWSLNETWAVELKPHGIRVNGLCPAATDTPMLRNAVAEEANRKMFPLEIDPEQYLATAMKPEDVALAVLNLLSMGPDDPVGQSTLIVARRDAERVARTISVSAH